MKRIFAFVAALALALMFSVSSPALAAGGKAQAKAANASGLLIICDPAQTYIDDTGVHMSVTVKSDSGLNSGVTINYAFNASATSIKNAARDAGKQLALDEEGTVILNSTISYMGCPTS